MHTHGSFFTSIFFFFNDTATTEIYTLSLHDALPIYAIFVGTITGNQMRGTVQVVGRGSGTFTATRAGRPEPAASRSEEHTSELQSQSNLVCRLLLEKKKKSKKQNTSSSILTTYLLKI